MVIEIMVTHKYMPKGKIYFSTKVISHNYACCTYSDHYFVLIIGTECIVSGYGYTSPSGPSANILRKATVPIVSWNECKTHFSFISPGTICTASGVPAKGSCPNDSGGPLICKRSNGQWTVFGVVSGGDCLMNKAGYNFYANVVGNLNWIKNLH